MVFTWHFLHYTTGYPVNFGAQPIVFPLALLDEGHTGVSLFMTLSGYLFAKILDGKAVHYAPFFWNRFLRLAPLLLIMVAITDAAEWVRHGFHGLGWLYGLALGLLLPTLPHGGWSITAELHFYFLLPALMWATRRWSVAPLLVVVFAIGVRAALFAYYGEIQYLTYWTITGHIDQFVLGIFAFRHRNLLEKRHAIAIAIAIGFAALWYGFDKMGGFYKTAASSLWIILPTVEAGVYSLLIAYYDTNFRPKETGISGAIGRAGAYSYSIYLLHMFVVFRAAAIIDTHVMRLSNFYVATAWSALLFALMVPVGHLSFKFIEEPFLRLRRPYIKQPRAMVTPIGESSAAGDLPATAGDAL